MTEITITDVSKHEGDVECVYFYRGINESCSNDADYEVHHLEHKTLHFCSDHHSGPESFDGPTTLTFD